MQTLLVEHTQNKLLKTPMFLVFHTFLNSIFCPINELHLAHLLNFFVRNESEKYFQVLLNKLNFGFLSYEKHPYDKP